MSKNKPPKLTSAKQWDDVMKRARARQQGKDVTTPKKSRRKKR